MSLFAIIVAVFVVLIQSLKSSNSILSYFLMQGLDVTVHLIHNLTLNLGFVSSRTRLIYKSTTNLTSAMKLIQAH